MEQTDDVDHPVDTVDGNRDCTSGRPSGNRSSMWARKSHGQGNRSSMWTKRSHIVQMDGPAVRDRYSGVSKSSANRLPMRSKRPHTVTHKVQMDEHAGRERDSGSNGSNTKAANTLPTLSKTCDTLQMDELGHPIIADNGDKNIDVGTNCGRSLTTGNDALTKELQPDLKQYTVWTENSNDFRFEVGEKVDDNVDEYDSASC